jgi:hypothetical protein
VLRFKFYCSEHGAQVYENSIGHAEAVHDILDESNYFCYFVLYYRFVFDPLSKFVDHHEDVLESSLGSF